VNAPTSITFQPAGGASLVLTNTAVPLVVTDPTGRVIHDDNPAVRLTDPNQIALQPSFFASIAAGIGTLTFPNTTGGLELSQPNGFPAGTWSLTVSDLAYKCTFEQPAGSCCAGGSTTSLYDVMVITKQTPGGAIPGSGNLDVIIYFATTVAGGNRPGTASAPLLAANAATDPDLIRMEATLRGLFAKANVNVRSVSYRDLPASVQAGYATGLNIDDSGPCSDLARLFKNAAEVNALHIFFVRSLIASDFGTTTEVVGVDGTIPGPATIGGSVGSGAAVSTSDLRRTTIGTPPRSTCPPPPDVDPIACGPDVTAYIIAHEAGHFLGLYHVTESEGTSFDPLIDTPMCPCLQCAPSPSARAQCASATPAPASPRSMSVSDCSASATCGGGQNLMFWLLESGSRGDLSLDQGRVMRANPLVQ
jgi:hypothetical protein